MKRPGQGHVKERGEQVVTMQNTGTGLFHSPNSSSVMSVAVSPKMADPIGERSTYGVSASLTNPGAQLGECGQCGAGYHHCGHRHGISGSGAEVRRRFSQDDRRLGRRITLGVPGPGIFTGPGYSRNHRQG